MTFYALSAQGYDAGAKKGGWVVESENLDIHV